VLQLSLRIVWPPLAYSDINNDDEREIDIGQRRPNDAQRKLQHD